MKFIFDINLQICKNINNKNVIWSIFNYHNNEQTDIDLQNAKFHNRFVWLGV